MLNQNGLERRTTGARTGFVAKRNGGFTLTEMVITLTLFAVLTAFAAPSFLESVRNNRLVTKTNDLVAAINLARQSAVARGQVVFLCHTNNASLATPSCNGGAASGWHTGYLVYAAPFKTQITTARNFTAGDTLIKKMQLTGNATDITVSDINAGTVIAFRGNGLVFGAAGNITLRVCDQRVGKPVGREIKLSPAGRLFTESGVLCT